MEKNIAKRIGRARRHARIRTRIMGTKERPRLSIYKSNRYLHAQIIDDTAGKTIAAGSTKDLAGKTKKMDAAQKLGVELARLAKAAGITTVVFDRGGFRYTGRVATLANAAREGGLKF